MKTDMGATLERAEAEAEVEGSVASSDLARAFDALTIAALIERMRARGAVLDAAYESGLPKAGPASLVRAIRFCPDAPEASGLAPDKSEAGVVGWSKAKSHPGDGAARESHIILPARAWIQGVERCVLLMALAVRSGERPKDPPVLLWGLAADAEAALEGAGAMAWNPGGPPPLAAALSRRWTREELEAYLHPARLERAGIDAAAGLAGAGAGPGRL